MKVFEVVEHRQRLDEVAPLLLYGAYAIGALLAGYTVVTSAEDAYQAIQYYNAGEKDGEPYDGGDLANDLGSEVAEVILGIGAGGAITKGPKIINLTWKQFQRLWNKSGKLADDIADLKKNYPSLSFIDRIPLMDIIKYGAILSAIAMTPDDIYYMAEEWKNNPDLEWEDIAVDLAVEASLLIATILLIKIGERGLKMTKPAFVAFWNYCVRIFREANMSETATGMGASSIATVSGNVGTMRSRNMYNADGTMKNGLEFGNLLGGRSKPNKKKKQKKNT